MVPERQLVEAQQVIAGLRGQVTDLSDQLSTTESAFTKSGDELLNLRRVHEQAVNEHRLFKLQLPSASTVSASDEMVQLRA